MQISLAVTAPAQNKFTVYKIAERSTTGPGDLTMKEAVARSRSATVQRIPSISRLKTKSTTAMPSINEACAACTFLHKDDYSQRLSLPDTSGTVSFPAPALSVRCDKSEPILLETQQNMSAAQVLRIHLVHSTACMHQCSCLRRVHALIAQG